MPETGNGPRLPEPPQNDANIPAPAGRQEAQVAPATQEAGPGQPPFIDDLNACLPPGYIYSHAERAICLENGHDLDLFCGPIHVLRRLRSRQGVNWLVEVEFADRDGTVQHLSVPETSLHMRPNTLLTALIDRGFLVFCSAAALAGLLKAWPDHARAFTSQRTGWFEHPEGGMDFVLRGGRVLGAVRTRVQPVVAIGPAAIPSRQQGSLEGWKNDAARLARGNPALIFAIAASLSGPLLHLARMDTMAFNFHGPSTVGKTLLLQLAASSIGAPTDLQRWTTFPRNIDEAQAASRDLLLALEAFPRSPATSLLDMLHMVGVGGGARSTGDGQHDYRYALLSTSELPIRKIFRRRKRDVPDDLAARLIDLPADSWEHGLFADLHGFDTPRAFAHAMDDAIARNHGHAMDAFLAWLTPNIDRFSILDRVLDDYRRRINAGIGLTEARLPPAAEQVLTRFALVAITGELATSIGVLPFGKNNTLRAVTEIASTWQRNLIAESDTRSSALQRAREFVLVNRRRFVDLEPGVSALPLAPDQAGWRDNEYAYIHSEVFKAELAAPDHCAAFSRELVEAGVLVTGTEKRLHQRRLPQTLVRDRPRVYQLDLHRLGIRIGESDDP